MRHIGRRSVLFCALAVAVLPLAWAGYNVWTSEFTLTQAELQERIGRKFPLNRRVARVFDVQLTNPRTTLDAANNRLITQIDARITTQIFMADPVLVTFAVNSGLKYQSSTRALLLDSPTAERIEISGVPARYSGELQAVGAHVAAQVLTDYPLYTFTPEELRIGDKEVEPGAITITPDGIKVEIKPR